MANLSEETIGTVLNLQRRVLQLINEATATEFILLEQYGETEATISDLEILQNVRERGTTYYVRLYRLLLQIAESQPVATSLLKSSPSAGETPAVKTRRLSAATLNLLIQSIEQTQAIADSSAATIQEVKRDWNLA